MMDVVRPTYAWQQDASIFVYRQLSEQRDVDSTRIVRAKIDQVLGANSGRMVWLTLGRLQAHTGKSVRQITAQDLLTMDAALAPLTIHTQFRRSLVHLWRVLTELGWINHESTAWPVHPSRQPQRTPEQIMDRYGVSSPHREVFIEYLKQRSAAMDYSTLCNTAQRLLKTFWLDIASPRTTPA